MTKEYMKESTRQVEEEKGQGWYGVRCIEGGDWSGYADYLYKKFKFFGNSTIYTNHWVRPLTPMNPEIREYFETEELALEAVRKTRC